MKADKAGKRITVPISEETSHTEEDPSAAYRRHLDKTPQTIQQTVKVRENVLLSTSAVLIPFSCFSCRGL